MRIIVCWLKKHNWLIQGEQAVSLYAENGEVAESWYYYECQRCGKLIRHEVVNLDNAPSSDDESNTISNQEDK